MKVFFLSFLFCIFSANAAVEIIDPNDLLGTIDNYINSNNFDVAFTVGDKAWYSNKDCIFTKNGEGKYSSECKPAETTLSEVTYKDSNQAIFGNITISKNQFNVMHGNFLRYYFLESFLDPELKSVSITMEKIQFENVIVSEKTVQAIRAFYTINACKALEGKEACFLLPQEMLLGRNLPLVAQILEHVYVRVEPVNFPVIKILDFQKQ